MSKKSNSFNFKISLVLSGIIKIVFGKILYHKFHFVPRCPPIVIVELASLCNLNCIMCEYPFMKRKKMIMDLNLAKKVIKECADFGVPRVILSRLGEPLLHPKIGEIISFAKGCGIRNVSMVCNGMLLSEDKARELIESGLDLITFSVDASNKTTFERIRPGSNFDTVIGNIEKFIKIRNDLSREKPWVEINSCLMRENLEDVPLIIEKWRSIVERIRVLPVAPLPQTKDQRIFDALQECGKKPCDVLWTRLVVLSNGEVTVCCADTEGTLSVGNARNSSIKDLWNSKKIHRIRSIHFRRSFHELPLCNTCYGNDIAWFKTEKEIIESYEKGCKPLAFLPGSFFA